MVLQKGPLLRGSDLGRKTYLADGLIVLTATVPRAIPRQWFSAMDEMCSCTFHLYACDEYKLSLSQESGRCRVERHPM